MSAVEDLFDTLVVARALHLVRISDISAIEPEDWMRLLNNESYAYCMAEQLECELRGLA
jgi:hypothetical protein